MHRRREIALVAAGVAALVAALGPAPSASAADPVPAPSPTSTATSTTTSTTTPGQPAPAPTSSTPAPPTPPATPPTTTTPASTPPTTAPPTTSASATAPRSAGTSTATGTTPAPAGTSARTATAAADPITDRWTQLGGSAGVLGDPVGARQAVPGGEFQDYARGRITWSAATGAWETIGAINTRYVAAGGAPALGFPTAPEQGVAGGATQVFTGARLWWSPATGAWETFGAIGDRYLAVGGPASVGFPTAAEQGVAGGSVQVFTRARLWWSPATGAWETIGAIGDRYQALGGAASLGFPTGTEQGVAGGAVQVFQRARIWWSPGSGAYETFGAIGDRFVAIGGPGALGFPLTGEQSGGGGTWQWFSAGSLWWSPRTGAWETKGDIAAQYVNGGGPVYSFYGFPSGPAYAYYGGTRQDFSGGSFLTGVQPVLDVTYSGVTASDVWATWRPGCPVGPSSLTLMRLNYWGFDNQIHRGELIIRSDLAARVASVFQAAMDDHFLIKKMWRVDYYGGDDPTAMAADNTSGFNCRQVTGGTGLSPHSYGIALDVNTLENPYWAANRWWPNADYTNRSVIRDGMLFGYSKTTKAFQTNGFEWGASYLDYQHFEYVG